MSRAFPVVRHSVGERLALLGLRVATVAGVAVLLLAALALAASGAHDLVERVGAGASGTLLLPVANSAIASVLVSVALLPLVLPALLDLRMRSPSTQRRGRWLVESLVLLPPLVSGISMVLVTELLHGWLFTDAVVPLCGGLLGLGLLGGARLGAGLERSLDRVPPDQLLAARALGASALEAWMLVGFPQVRRSVAANLLRTGSRVFSDSVVVLVLWLWLGTPEAGTTLLGTEISLAALAGRPVLADLGLVLFVLSFGSTLLADRIDPPGTVR